MATAAYLAQLGAFSRSPVLMVKWTVPGDVAGSTTFRFQNRGAKPINLQLGADVRPYLRSGGFAGRQTRIRPDKGLTERASASLVFEDDPDAQAFDSAVFTVTTGGSFFQRIIVAQPDYVGTQIEVLRGFVASGFVEADFERIFLGRVEHINFNNDNSVVVVAKDELAFVDRQFPAEISDENVISAKVETTDTTITVIDGSEFSDPADLPSKDFFPVVVQIDPDGTSPENVILNSISGNVLSVQANHLDSSEDFSDTAAWTPTSVAVTADDAVGPLGGSPRADKIADFATGDTIVQISALTSLATTAYTFSVWLKSATGSSGSITLRVRDSTGAGGFNDTSVTVTTSWQRFEASHTMTGAPTGTVEVQIIGEIAGIADIFAWGAQLEQATTRGFYAATNATGGDAAAGRGAWGTTAGEFFAPTDITEIGIYRLQLNDDGVHPIVVLRDLDNRGEIPIANINQASFDGEFDFIESSEVRRGEATGFIDSTILKPKNLLTHTKEIREEALIDQWFDEDGRVKVRYSFRVVSPDATIFSLTDETHIAFKSLSIKANKITRATRVFVYYNIRAGAEGNKPADFLKSKVSANFIPETISGKKNKRFFSLWIYRPAEALALGGRYISRNLRGARLVDATIEMKDDTNVPLGDVVEIDSNDIREVSGSVAVRGKTKWQTTQKRDKRENGQIILELMEARQQRQGLIGFIGIADFPGASAADIAKYTWIGDSLNKMSDGTAGWTLI